VSENWTVWEQYLRHCH